MISDLISIEQELEESMHLNRILGQDQLSIVLNSQLLKSEETKIGEYLVHHNIISVCSNWVSLEKYCREHF